MSSFFVVLTMTGQTCSRNALIRAGCCDNRCAIHNTFTYRTAPTPPPSIPVSSPPFPKYLSACASACRVNTRVQVNCISGQIIVGAETVAAPNNRIIPLVQYHDEGTRTRARCIVIAKEAGEDDDDGGDGGEDDDDDNCCEWGRRWPSFWFSSGNRSSNFVSGGVMAASRRFANEISS